MSAARRAPHESDGTTVATVFDPGGAAIAPAQHASGAMIAVPHDTLRRARMSMCSETVRAAMAAAIDPQRVA